MCTQLPNCVCDAESPHPIDMVERASESVLPWPDPTPEMLAGDPRFDAIWNVIKTWDINVAGVYTGYMGATGNHVRAILDALPRT